MAVSRIVRYTVSERSIHLVAAVTYVYVLLTGLAFWTPPLYWLAIVLGGGYLSRMLHPVVGLVFAGAVVWMFAVWRRDMKTTEEDRNWRRAMRHYIRNEDHVVPPAGRFNYGQKLLFWLMVWGGVVLLLSGIVMWFVSGLPPAWRGLRAFATFVHAAAALLTIGGFIVHVYMGVAVVPEGLTAILHGQVTEEWAAQHHPSWYSRVKAEEGTRTFVDGRSRR
jgi:formate dehydrogenase subunit gamma